MNLQGTAKKKIGRRHLCESFHSEQTRTDNGGNIVRCSCSQCDDYDNKLAQYNGVDGSTQTVTAGHAMYSSHNETMMYQTRNSKLQRGKLEKEGQIHDCFVSKPTQETSS